MRIKSIEQNCVFSFQGVIIFVGVTIFADFFEHGVTRNAISMRSVGATCTACENIYLKLLVHPFFRKHRMVSEVPSAPSWCDTKRRAL